MTFTTPVDIARSTWSIGYHDSILTLGSCFSDHIARMMQEYYLRVTPNPYGTLYNPVSIAHHIDEAIASMPAPRNEGGAEGRRVVMITFGTAWVYIDRQVGNDLDAVVDNCLKRPAADFIRRRLTVEEIVSLWQPIVQRHSDCRFIFTVSPIRHLKDGLHANQLSKSILLLAIDTLQSPIFNLQSSIDYFPSYELILDELRDYRYYAEDMMHPTDTAVRYIWERLVDTYMYDAATQSSMHELHQLWLDAHHRPLHPDSPEYERFRTALSERFAALSERYPFLQM